MVEWLLLLHEGMVADLKAGGRQAEVLLQTETLLLIKEVEFLLQEAEQLHREVFCRKGPRRPL